MKLSLLIFLIGIIVFAGCKDKAAKELIINEWRFTEFSGPGAEIIPDSVKKKVYATATMTFKKDGSYEQTGGSDGGTRKGKYSLSEDGKTIYSTEDGSGTDTVMILQISKDKMVVSPKSQGIGGKMQLTMVPK